MVRLDLTANADDADLADSLDFPTAALGAPTAPGSSSESESDDDAAPAALSTLAARQGELNRERERREADARCVLW